jgi:hypothetical protein
MTSSEGNEGKIKYLKKEVPAYLCKGQVMLHVCQNEWDPKLILTLNEAEFVATEKKLKG